jgi:protein TonB
MDTIMNTTSKAFGVSLAFHSLMALFALLMLNAMHPPLQTFSLPMKHITLVSLTKKSDAATPLAQQMPPPPQTQKTPLPPVTTPTVKPIVKTTPLPEKTVPMTSQTPAIPTPVSQIQPTPSVETKPITAPAPISTPAQSQIKAQPKANTASELQSFKASLRTKIKQNLRYPPSARRRGMEGEVSVRFTVFGDGSIRDISIRQGEEIFHNAAKAAVASSSGIDVPKSLTESLPMEMDLTLEFKLNS